MTARGVSEMNASRMARSVGLAIAACAFAGCAVLTIDVDVYKGPLANDDKVQVEQLTAMTMGAKPLLVQLRDRLEGKGTASLKEVRARRGYQADFIPAEEVREGGAPFFTNEHAKQVNAVLSLYIDKTGNKLTTLFEAGKGALNDYARAYSILAYSASTDQRLWAAFQGGFIASSSDVTNEELKKLWTSVPDKLNKLKTGYKYFLLSPPSDRIFRSSGLAEVFKAHCELAKTVDQKSYPELAKKFEALPKTTTDGTSHQNQVCDKYYDTVSANFLFKTLEGREIFELHSKLLFTSDSEERKLFVDRAAVVAESFTDSREALARLWRLTLHFIAVVNTPEFENASKQKELTRVAARLASNLISKDQLTEFRANAHELKHPASDAAGVNSIGDIESIKQLLNDLRSANGKTDDVLIKKPQQTAYALIQADALWASEDLRVNKSLAERYQPKESRKFGIVTGPVDEAEKLGQLIPRELLEQFRSISASVGIGLEKGRLDAGIESLIESYLEEKDKLNPASFAIDRQRDRLLDALVAFAQKILMLGNFNILFEQEEMKEEDQPYVSLLQAIGNAILTHVNELQTKKTYADSGRGMIEARALNAENATLNPGEKGRLIEGLHPPPDFPSETKDPAKVMDLVIAKLQYEHVQALRKGLKDEATSLEAAIEAASTHRANMVYIRPASFYLRNSFLFTGLQKDSPAVWKNMLTEHAWRQFWEPTGKKQAEIIGEFDKQYWQNINTVRVAGGGKTNYVIAKDDVGNWYVKNFSSDPESIIQGAKSLALFAAKGAVSVGEVDKAQRLLKRSPKDKEDETDKSAEAQAQSGVKKSPRDKDQQAPVTAQGAVMNEQRKAAEASHGSRTGKLLTELAEESKGLDDKVSEEWANKGLRTDEIGFLNKTVVAPTNPPSIKADTSPPTREKIDAAFKSITNYRNELVSKISKERFVTALTTEKETNDRLLQDDNKKKKELPETIKTKEGEIIELRRQAELPANADKKPQITKDIQTKEAELKVLRESLQQAEEASKDHERKVSDATKDLEIVKTLDIDKAKSAVKPVFARFLLKYVDIRAEDLENYRTRLRAIRSDNAG
jgi:hypothetical protein